MRNYRKTWEVLSIVAKVRLEVLCSKGDSNGQDRR